MHFLFGKPPVKLTNAPLTEMDIKEVVKIIKTFPKLRDATKIIRETKDDLTRKELKSSTLPYILPFKYSEFTRNSSNFVSASAMIFEVDHVKDLTDKREIVTSDSEVMLEWVSVSGDGLKFAVELETSVTAKHYVKVYEILRRRYEKKFQMELDPANKDLARVQYLAYDSNAYFNAKSVKVQVVDIIKTLDVFEKDWTENNKKPILEYADADIRKAINHAREHGFLEAKDEQIWWELSMSLASLGENGRQYFLLLSGDNPNYPGDTPGKLDEMYTKKFLNKWGDYHDEERKLTMNSFFYKIEKLYGFKAPKPERSGRKSLEFRMAENFVKMFRGDLLVEITAAMNVKQLPARWHGWDGMRFKLLPSGALTKYWRKFVKKHREIAVDVATAAQAEVNNMKEQLGSSVPDDGISLGEIHSVESSRSMNLGLGWCISDDDLGVLPDKLDKDPNLFNTLNGTIDLRTGKLKPHSKDDLLTMLADVEYKSKTKCPNWDNFLMKICCADVELIKFLQRSVGYSMTGHTSNHQLFFMYGVGMNGKSTFIETLKMVFGDYHITTGYETFAEMQRSASGASENILRLKGSRLIVSAETAGGYLNDAVVKQLTGGDTIVARGLHQSSIEFTPVAKIWIAGNHKPQLENFDLGIKRRLKFIPFNYRFSGSELLSDKEVRDQFEQEKSGILNWALAGARMWYSMKAAERIETCEAVERESRVFFEESNPVEQFLQEYFIDLRKPDSAGFVETKDRKDSMTAQSIVWELFQEFKMGMSRKQVSDWGKIKLFRKLDELGFQRHRTDGITFIVGLQQAKKRAGFQRKNIDEIAP